ncbi:hypothetical protein THAR02_10628 [Trichoderma harzianum]|uniref:Uncharacterized protein n=1 Tax=Trichoderma harzianum TaxID=5544 RepID=A0A0F9X914_TRIHA|nr:hypothetical protein THAR02_10628 [Trichoderma harzianum]
MPLPKNSFSDTTPGSPGYDALHSSPGDYTPPIPPNTPGSPDFEKLDAGLGHDSADESLPGSSVYERLPAKVKTGFGTFDAIVNRLTMMIDDPPPGATLSELLRGAISQLKHVTAFDAQMLEQLSTPTTEKEREDILVQYRSEAERRRMNLERLLLEVPARYSTPEVNHRKEN